MGGDECHNNKCRKDNIELLRFITDGMRKNEIDYWLDFGGLLGVIREGGMIEGDDDLDICALTDEREKIIAYFKQINEDPHGLYTAFPHKSNTHGGALYKIRPKAHDNKALLDLFFFAKEDDGTLKSLWTSLDDTNMETIFPTQSFWVHKWGSLVNIPHNPETRLREKYGDDFMVPKNDKKTPIKRTVRSLKVATRQIRNTNWTKLVVFLLYLVIVATTLRYVYKRW